MAMMFDHESNANRDEIDRDDAEDDLMILTLTFDNKNHDNINLRWGRVVSWQKVAAWEDSLPQGF